jgi:amino acid adenylation domain-containing protein
MSDLKERLSGLSPVEQRTLLAETLRKKTSKPRLAPASFAQERLWFLDQLEPGNPAYNMPAAVRLCGRLDVAALCRSLNEIVRRHETLRTTFAATDGRPVQVIAPVVTSPLAVVDLRSCPEMRRKTEMWRLIAAEARRPFDLARGPLFRATLLRLDGACPVRAARRVSEQGQREQHVLLLNVSHIVSDGWSQGVLLRELAALYEAFSNARPLPLPELPLQYADFARWQREWLQGEVLDAQLSYWKRQLGDAPAVLELPTDRPRPAAQTFHGVRQTRVWPMSSSQALKALSQREGVTLFMTLLAAFQVLLYRYTGQTDLVVGSPVAGRNRAELEGLIGFFVNTLVLRTDLSGDPTFRELLRRVRETVMGAFAHQDLPFEKLVDGLQLERDLSRNPLCQVMFALQNAPLPALELPELTLTPLETDSGAARFDLTLSVWDTPQSLREVWEYNTDLFDARTIERMQGHFQTLLECIVANEKASEQRLSDLSALTGTERQQLLVEWNDTSTAYAEDKCIHELFEAQVKRTPDAVAVVFEDGCLSYDALSRRANKLAHHLQGLGVGPEVLVGIYVERSPEMLVGLLATLKAGGAYIPLDPVYPQERLAFMLKDTRAPVLLTQRHLLDKLPAHQAQIVCLDSDWPMIASRPQTAPPCATAAGNLAYTIYTSGSTGRPKGVQILHRAVVNFLDTMRQRPGLTARDTILSVTTLSFDIALLELFLPLTIGACVVLVSRATASDGVQLIERLATFRATVMQATPATWRLLLAADWQGDSRLRILCGGEALPRALAHQLLARADSVWNLYGPTETTVWSTVYELTTSDDLISIGRPIANTESYLLDSHLRPVPIGVSGELYIGGAGLARGYLHRPGLSAERFVPNPFPATSFPSLGGDERGGARLYKTGDLARYRPDGNIEFLRRADYQVKLRGFRIELGEIEAVLMQHPAVCETVALVQEDVPQQKRLVAYLVTEKKSAPTVSELRRFLQERLPDYMLPSIFVTLDALPLTPNGKLDRRALPAPEHGRPELEQAFVAPRTPLEETLSGIWMQILGLERVGVHDNFFDLGGHSLLATQVISRVRDVCQVDVPLRILFGRPTVAGLAAGIAQHQVEQRDSQASIVPTTDETYTEQLLERLDTLADEEMDVLLGKMLAGEEGWT